MQMGLSHKIFPKIYMSQIGRFEVTMSVSVGRVGGWCYLGSTIRKEELERWV